MGWRGQEWSTGLWGSSGWEGSAHFRNCMKLQKSDTWAWICLNVSFLHQPIGNEIPQIHHRAVILTHKGLIIPHTLSYYCCYWYSSASCGCPCTKLRLPLLGVKLYSSWVEVRNLPVSAHRPKCDMLNSITDKASKRRHLPNRSLQISGWFKCLWENAYSKNKIILSLLFFFFVKKCLTK